jgi:hypothetical protein
MVSINVINLSQTQSRLKDLGARAKKILGGPIKSFEKNIFITNIKIRKNASKNYLFLNLLLNLGFSKDLDLSRAHLERGPGQSPLRPYVKMALV